MNARAAKLAGLLLASACAASPARPDPLAPRFARDDAQQARRLAPDLYARAERARALAAAADADPLARADREQQAQWLLEAAIADARRIELERAAASAEARAASELQARAQLEHERLAVEQQIRREQSARAERAAGERDAPWRVRRARVLLAAARALGLPQARADEVATAIAAAERAPAGRAMAAANGALREAERALGAARAAHGSASAEQAAGLVEMARERGFTAERTPRGVALSLASLFAPGSAQLAPHGRERLAQLAGLAAAHPHGALAIEHAGQGPSTARARRIEQVLRAGETRARVELVKTSAVAGDAPLLVFRAYGSG